MLRSSLFLFTALILSTFCIVDSSAAQPNVLILLADDLGYADIGVQGCKDIPTPHIDSLAKNGVRCTSGYVSSCMCSPSRAGLMTGRSQSRFGHEINWEGNGPSGEKGLPLTEKTFPQLMKAGGYRTGVIGKWHLGNEARFHPLARGFDEFFVCCYKPRNASASRANLPSANPTLRMQRNRLSPPT